MKSVLLTVITLIFALNIEASTSSSGNVIKLIGKAWKLSKNLPKPTPLRKGSSVSSGDIIQTEKKSFVKVEMTDETILSVGPNSKLEIKHYEYQTNSIRKTIYKLQYGKLRSLIKKKAKEGDEIRVNTKAVAMGIRGTEILSNAYVVQNKATTDTMLLSGHANASVNGTSKCHQVL